MIQLNEDSLLFQTSNGETIPCSAELVTIELIGDAANQLDPEIIRNASAAVLHYFKEDLGKTHVSLAEFSSALERVLRGFGFTVKSGEERQTPKVAESDLSKLASGLGKGSELFFFPTLRAELKRKLRQSPQILRFSGLRTCVKELTGTRRWTHRCQDLNDQIVDYLRDCLLCEAKSNSCALVVC